MKWPIVCAAGTGGPTVFALTIMMKNTNIEKPVVIGNPGHNDFFQNTGLIFGQQFTIFQETMPYFYNSPFRLFYFRKYDSWFIKNPEFKWNIKS